MRRLEGDSECCICPAEGPEGTRSDAAELAGSPPFRIVKIRLPRVVMVASGSRPLGTTKPAAATVAAYRSDLVGVARPLDDDVGVLTSST